MIFQKQNEEYLPWIKSQTIRLNASMETVVDQDYPNEWTIALR